MPDLNTIKKGLATLPMGPPLVVAVMGGTNGIGNYIAKAFAKAFSTQGAKLRIYIIGRKPADGDAILKYGRETAPGSDWRFVRVGDGSLMNEVDRVSREIIGMEEKEPFNGGPARLDALYMTQALSPFQPSEGEYLASFMFNSYYDCL